MAPEPAHPLATGAELAAAAALEAFMRGRQTAFFVPPFRPFPNRASSRSGQRGFDSLFSPSGCEGGDSNPHRNYPTSTSIYLTGPENPASATAMSSAA